MRPIHSDNNRSIRAQNGQAYHGQQSTITNGTRPAVLGSRTAEERPGRQHRRRPVAPHVRSFERWRGRLRASASNWN